MTVVRHNQDLGLMSLDLPEGTSLLSQTVGQKLSHLSSYQNDRKVLVDNRFC